MDKFRYRGFISYSRADEGFAKKLHRALEKFTLPNKDGNHSTGRFFRDEDELSGGNDVGATLKGALSESEALIIICSPNSAQSFWVNKEIEYYCSLHEDPKVIPCIVSGTPGGDLEASSEAQRECFPPILRGGNTGDASNEQFNPLALSLKAEGFERLRMKVICRILDQPFDALWRREKRSILFRTRFAVRNFLFALLLASLAIWFIVELGNVINNMLVRLDQIEQELIALGYKDLAQDLFPSFFGFSGTTGTNWYSGVFRAILMWIVAAFAVSYLFHAISRRFEYSRGWKFIAAQGTFVFASVMTFYFYNEGLSLDVILESLEATLAALSLSAAYLISVEGFPALIARIIRFRTLR